MAKLICEALVTLKRVDPCRIDELVAKSDCGVLENLQQSLAVCGVLVTSQQILSVECWKAHGEARLQSTVKLNSTYESLWEY